MDTSELSPTSQPGLDIARTVCLDLEDVLRTLHDSNSSYAKSTVLKFHGKRLEAIRKDVTETSPAVVCIMGDTGVGKSRLCYELLARGLDDESKQKLARLNMYGKRGKPITQVPTQFKYGRQLASQEGPPESNCRVVELESPILKKITLVDTPGICDAQGNPEGSSSPPDSTIRYLSAERPDDIWIVLPAHTRAPPLERIASVLEQMLTIQFFSGDPLLTPSVTLVCAPHFREGTRPLKMRMDRFLMKMKAAIQYLFSLDLGKQVELSDKWRLQLDHLRNSFASQIECGRLHAIWHYQRLTSQLLMNLTKKEKQIDALRLLEEKCDTLYDTVVARRATKACRELYYIATALKLRCSTAQQKNRKYLSSLSSKFEPIWKDMDKAWPPAVECSLSPETNSFRWNEEKIASRVSFLKRSVEFQLNCEFEQLRCRFWLPTKEKITELLKADPKPEYLMVLLDLQETCDSELALWSQKLHAAVRREQFNQIGLLSYLNCDSARTAGKKLWEDWHQTNHFPELKQLMNNMVDNAGGFRAYMASPKATNKPRNTQKAQEAYNKVKSCCEKIQRLDVINKELAQSAPAYVHTSLMERPIQIATPSWNTVETARKKDEGLKHPPDHGYHQDSYHRSIESDFIECHIKVDDSTLQYEIPTLLEERLQRFKSITLVPSKKRPEPMNSQATYPRVFANDDTELAILVVEQGEVEDYRLHLKDRLWTREDPTRSVVLMCVHWDNPNWRLWNGRKRQVIKLLMDLLLQKQVISTARYVTHNDDLCRLETVNEFGNPVQVDMNLATEFLSRIMEHEGVPACNAKREKPTLIESEPEKLKRSIPIPQAEPQQSPDEFADFLTKLCAKKWELELSNPDFRRCIKEVAHDKSPRNILWEGKEKTPEGFSWPPFQLMIESLLPELKERLKEKWKHLLTLRHRVGMVSVLNKQQPYFYKESCPAQLSAHTHKTSTQMYSYVLYDTLAIRDVHYLKSEDFFAIMPPEEEENMKSLLNNKTVDKKSQQYLDMTKKAMKYGYKHEDKAFAKALMAAHRLCFLTPVIHMTRARVATTSTPSKARSTVPVLSKNQRKITDHFRTKPTQDENAGSTPLPKDLPQESRKGALTQRPTTSLPQKRREETSSKKCSPSKKAKRDHLTH